MELLHQINLELMSGVIFAKSKNKNDTNPKHKFALLFFEICILII